MSDLDPRLLVQLAFAVAVLSWPADRQLDYLRRAAPEASVDELALEFDDVVGIVDDAQRAGWLTEQDTSRIRALSAELGRISGIGSFWTEQAIRESQEWEQIRSLARSVIVRK
jgi:hypothetical protein